MPAVARCCLLLRNSQPVQRTAAPDNNASNVRTKATIIFNTESSFAVAGVQWMGLF